MCGSKNHTLLHFESNIQKPKGNMIEQSVDTELKVKVSNEKVNVVAIAGVAQLFSKYNVLLSTALVKIFRVYGRELLC